MNILIADPNFEILHILKEAIQHVAPVPITEVSDGRKACRLMRRETFDLVLIDLRMVHVNGLACVAQMRQAGKLTPVVMTTGYLPPQKEFLDRIKALNIRELLRKPFDLITTYYAISGSFEGRNSYLQERFSEAGEKQSLMGITGRGNR